MFVLILQYVLLLVVVICGLIEWYRYRWTKKLAHIGGPPPKPIVGNALDFAPKLDEILIQGYECVRLYGKLFTLWIGPLPYIIVTDALDMQVILSSPRNMDKGQVYNLLRPWLSDGLLISKGDKWFKRRRILTPAFHFSILQQFTEVFNEESSVFVEQIKHNVDGKAFDIYPYSTLCSLDIICRTAMGISINAQGDANNEYVQAIYNICDIIMSRGLSPWKRLDWLFNITPEGRKHNKSLEIVHGTTHRVINARRQRLTADQGPTDSVDDFGIKKKRVFLDVLLESSIDGRPLTDTEIREEVDTFMFEGHDTVSSAISFALYMLANNPACQDKVFAEQVQMFGDDLDRDPVFSELLEMKYLELVIKETLRICPSVPFIVRNLKEEVVLSGKVIPSGVDIFMSITSMHHDADNYTDPMKFDPDRFLSENTAEHAYKYIPFSAGNRNCIGQKFAYLEMKATLSKIVRHYELMSAGPEHAVKLLPAIIMKSVNGVHVKIRRRVYPNESRN